MEIDDARTLYEASCNAAGPLQEEDHILIRNFLYSSVGRKFYRHVMEIQRDMQLIPATKDLTTDAGVKEALKAQGTARGWANVLDQLWDLAKEEEDNVGRT